MKYYVARTSQELTTDKTYRTYLEIIPPSGKGYGTGNFIIVTSNEPDVFEPLARYEIEIPDEVTD